MFKRTTVLMLVTLLGTGLVATPVARAQTTWYVDDDAPNDPGPGDPNVSDPDEDGSPEHPFDAIQEGIDAATNGDTVLVLDGTYTGTGNKNLDFHGKAITVRSVNGPDNCIIDCQQDGRGFYFHSGETPDSVVHGLTVRNGWVDRNSPGGEAGGGIHCLGASPSIANCIIARNTAYALVDCAWGGGIYCYNGSNPVLSDCLIIGNAATFDSPNLTSSGGGIICSMYSNPLLIRCRLIGNFAFTGAGMLNGFYSSPLLLDCLFAGNKGRPRASWAISGGIDNMDSSSPMVVNCRFVGNSGSFGGALGNYFDSNPTVVNCLFSGNVAVGPGIFVGGSAIANDLSNPAIVNCTIAANSAEIGGALAARADEPMLCGEIRNCILWNPGEEIGLIGPCDITVAHSDVQDGYEGEGNINADPLFVAGASAVWTTDALYDPQIYQITLTDGNANWSENELAGKFVNPDTTQALQFVIVGNTATTMTVWADWTAIDAGASWVVTGMSYQIHDYHVTGGASPCIDAADDEAVPADTFDLDEDDDTDEPIPFDLDGKPRFVDDPDTEDTGNSDPDYPDLPIVDMGAYEFQVCAGDIDGDNDTDHADLGALLGAWGSQPGDPNWNPNADLDGDGHIGHGDLGVFLPDWGCGT